MTRGHVLTLATAALLLELLPLVAAHGDEHSDGGMTADMSQAAQPQAAQDGGGPRSYWSLNEHSGLMYMHIALETVAWFGVLPVGVMFSIARSRLALPSQFAFLIVNALALLLGVVYNHKTPELYENNAHSKMGWLFTWIASAWVFMALIQVYVGRTRDQSLDGYVAQPMTTANMAQYQRVQDEELPQPSRWSNDSGQGTERNSASLFGGHSRSPSVESEIEQFTGPTRRYTRDEDDHRDEDAEKRGFLRNNAVDRFFTRNVGRFAVGKPLKWLRFFYVLIERTVVVMGFFALTTGTVVYGGIAVFNVLAHYIKGGIFFGYGVLTLGRWMGAFADFGWAWNVKPPKEVVGRRKAAIPSAEFTESFVIFLYGCTNVFLEHLAAWGDAWTAQDLEHVSISVLFFGGGLLGMIVESRKMRDLLNSAVVVAQPPSQQTDETWQQPVQYRFPMNPMPGLIILLLGKMMGSHHQASMLSTMIHSQWGGMFMGFAMARAVTYITLYISPPKSYLPSRPPSEIVTAFCLIAGGITFIISNKDTVAALESYNLDAMFTFTVTMGVVALIMAWETVLIAIKGWAVRWESSSHFAKYHQGVLA
ncbi:integral membrane protein [Polyplosphaeria fusca]|uniref:Integral membrane protein n=1 Tax=Polyplosphaeria fusca TaxID=682080 RepID=A0A9P4QPC2_9PLEO|nr:integral membrane protein [Polyplosphaeria fusca]